MRWGQNCPTQRTVTCRGVSPCSFCQNRVSPQWILFFFFLPSRSSGQASCMLRLFCTLHQRGGWPRLCHPSLRARIQTSGAGSSSARCQTWRGSSAGSLLCSAWLAGEKISVSLEPFYRNPTGYGPTGDMNIRSTCETSPTLPGGTGVGLAVNIIFHNSGTFWGRITHNELMLTQKVPDTVAPRRSPHPLPLWRTVSRVTTPAQCNTTAYWTSSSLCRVIASKSWRIPSPCAHGLLLSPKKALQNMGKRVMSLPLNAFHYVLRKNGWFLVALIFSLGI